MPTILALDTATADLAAAVRTDAACVSRSVPSGRRTGSLLTPTVAQVCEEAGVARADLDAIAVGVGPGPYTSLRAGLMFARTAGFALGIPVVGACTLDVIARGCRTRVSLIVSIPVIPVIPVIRSALPQRVTLGSPREPLPI